MCNQTCQPAPEGVFVDGDVHASMLACTNSADAIKRQDFFSTHRMLT
jgi:hypothetical protein